MAQSGNLHVEIIEARLTRDTSTFTGMDPYVKITYRMEEFKTATKDGKNPEWNEAFDIDVKYVGDDMIIQVMDKCTEGDDTVSIYVMLTVIIFAQVGETNIKASSLIPDIDDWFPIQYKGKQSGSLHLKSTWQPASMDANQTATPMLGDTSGIEMTHMQPVMLPPINQAQPMM